MFKYIFALLLVSSGFAQSIWIHGKVQSTSGSVIPNATVKLVSINLVDLSDNAGDFEILRLELVSIDKYQPIKITRPSHIAYDILGRKVKGSKSAPIRHFYKNTKSETATPLYKRARSLDTLEVSADGYNDRKIPIDEYVGVSVNVTLTEEAVVLNPPEPVLLKNPQNITKTSMQVLWAKSTDPDFVRYELYSSTSPNVTTNNKLEKNINDIDDWWEPVKNLTPNTTYYFKIFVVSTNGLKAGSNEIQTKTLADDTIPVDTVLPPEPVELGSAQNITQTGMHIIWHRSTSEDFSHYSLYSSTSPGVTVNSNLVKTISDLDTWNLYVGGLTPNTTYYYKIFVVDNSGLSAGSQEKAIKTLEDGTVDPPTCGDNQLCDDRDGQVYKTVQIGNQIWQSENMNFNVSGSLCYDNNPDNCDIYGRLYNFEQAQNACPEGWHLPSKDDYDALIQYMRDDGVQTGDFDIHLMSTSWEGGLDTYGFNALSAGLFNGNSFGRLNSSSAGWWTSSDHTSDNWKWEAEITFSDFHTDITLSLISQGVRCIKN